MKNNVWFEGPILESYAPQLDKSITVLGAGNGDMENRYDSLADAQVIVAGGIEGNSELFAKTPNLLAIVRLGIGYDRISIPEATEAGVAVCNTPDGPTTSTAECAITLMMGVARNLRVIDLKLRRVLAENGRRPFYLEYKGMEIYGKQLGLVGCGRIGSHVARVAQGLGMKVAAFDPYCPPEKAAEAGIQLIDSMEELLGMADVVSLHLPLNDETHKIMNAERFAQMKKGSIFINTARGGHVDEDALLGAIESGHLFGAGLDVTDPEPPLPTSPLLQHENVIITPHIASATYDGKLRIYEMAMEQVMMVLRGERPTSLINPEVWARVREKWESQ